MGVDWYLISPEHKRVLDTGRSIIRVAGDGHLIIRVVPDGVEWYRGVLEPEEARRLMNWLEKYGGPRVCRIKSVRGNRPSQGDTMIKPETETYTVVLHWAGKESTFRTKVTIDDSQPFTDVYDTAAERLYSKHPTCDVIFDEDIT